MSGPTIEQKIEEFKQDLKLLDHRDMLRRHVTFGECFALDHERYYGLRSDIAAHFLIHPNEVFMAGSGKLGFSLSPKHPFTIYTDESDLDIAIVSSRLFDDFWQAVLDYWDYENDWENLKSFQKYLFRGWIRPDLLPSQNFGPSIAWMEFFDELNASRRYGPSVIKAGIYKSWHFVDKYYSHSIRTCKSMLELK